MAQQPIRLDIKLQGDKALALALKAGFDEKTLASYSNVATLNAARTLSKPMKAAAPKRTGKLEKAIGARRSKKRGGGAVVGIRAGKKTGVWYRWRAVYPAGPHEIPAGKRFSVLSFGGINTKLVNHPGKRGDTFVTDTANANLDKVKETYTKTIAKLMTDKAFRKRVKGLRAKYRGR